MCRDMGCKMCKDMNDVSIDMCIDMRVDMRIDMRRDMSVGEDRQAYCDVWCLPVLKLGFGR